MSQDFPIAKVYLALAAGLIAFGFAPILVRTAQNTPALVLASYRTVFAVLLLLPYWLIKRKKTALSEKKKEKMLMTLAGICLGLHFCCWIASLYYTSVASASTLVAVHPIILILIEGFWFRRRFAATSWAGVFMAFAGSVILGIADSQADQAFADPLFGNFLALSAAMIFVIYLLIGQQIRQKREWVDYVFPVYFFAALTCIMLALLTGENLSAISPAGVAAGLGLAFGPQILGHGSMNYAVKFVSPTLLSTLILIEPLFASILAFFLFDEFPPLLSIAAMSIILIGVGLTWRRKADNN